MVHLLLVLALVHHLSWTERVAVHHAVATHLQTEHSPVKDFTVLKADLVGTFARARIKPLKPAGLDEATVLLQRERGSWKVLVMGTALGKETFSHYHIPPELSYEGP